MLDANAAALSSFAMNRHQIARQTLEGLTDLGRDERRRVMGSLQRTRRATMETHGRRADGTSFAMEVQLAVTSFRGEERVLVQLEPGGEPRP